MRVSLSIVRKMFRNDKSILGHFSQILNNFIDTRKLFMHVIINHVNDALDILPETVRNEIAQNATEDKSHRINNGIRQPIHQNISMHLCPYTSNFIHSKILHVNIEVRSVNHEVCVDDELIGATFQPSRWT